MSTAPLPRVFIGASSEAKRVADTLQDLLRRHKVCDPHVWDQGTFRLTDNFLESLIKEAGAADFAILLATQDDAIAGRDQMVPRDNVMLELGLFIGALGRERTILVADHSAGGIKLPSDMSGITHAPYSTDSTNNLRAALSGVALQITEHIEEVGSRRRAPTERRSYSVSVTPPPIPGPPPRTEIPGVDELEKLQWEMELIAQSARAQGWKVKTSATALRLENPRRDRFSFSIARRPRTARAELRPFAAKLRAHGLRVSRAVREPIESLL